MAVIFFAQGRSFGVRSAVRVLFLTSLLPILLQGCGFLSGPLYLDTRPLAYDPSRDPNFIKATSPVSVGQAAPNAPVNTPGLGSLPATNSASKEPDRFAGNVSTSLSRSARERGSGVSGDARGSRGFWSLMKSLTESAEDTSSRIGQLQVGSATLGSTASSLQSTLYEPASVNIKGAGENAVFIEAVRLARDKDPEYKQGELQFEAEQLQSRLSALAYGPRLGFNNRFQENENASRTTLSLVQPILNLDLIVALKESEPRLLQAQLDKQEGEYDLVVKVLASVTGLIQSREKFSVNKARIEALQNEAKAAEKEYQYGRGTLTDYRDAMVRLEQARAESASIQADLQSAIEELAQLTGKMPEMQDFNLSRSVRQLKLAPLGEYLLVGKQTNADVVRSRLQERMTELDAVRSKGRFVPSLYYSASKSYSTLGDNESSGLTFSLDMPLDFQAFTRSSLADKKVDQARLKTESVESKVKIAIKRMHAKVSNGLTEVNLRLKAIDAAQESLKATEKSFQGGVRSRLDVLDSVQTLYRVREEYIRSVMQLSKDFLSLQRMASQPVGPTVFELERLLF